MQLLPVLLMTARAENGQPLRPEEDIMIVMLYRVPRFTFNIRKKPAIEMQMLSPRA
jgi:hypothetical protein